MQHQRLERRVPVCTQGFKRYGPRLVMHAMSSLPTKGATDFGFNAPWPGPAEVIGVHFDDPPPAQRSIEYISQASYASLDGPSWIDLEAREPRNRDLDAGSLHRHLFRGRYSPIDHKTLSNLYASPDVEPSHEEEPPPDINLELENLADWNLNNNFSDLDALPCANYDPETDFDIEYQNLFASTVPASSIEETGREEELRIDFDLEPENLINWGPNVSCPALSALPFANVDIRTDLGSIHENASTFNVQMHPDLGTSRGYDSSTLYNNPSRSSQPKTTSISPPAPSASTSILPNDLPLGPPQTSSEPSISQSLLHAPPKADPLPLPPASNFCCPNCRGKFSSRLRLEYVLSSHKSLPKLISNPQKPRKDSQAISL